MAAVMAGLTRNLSLALMINFLVIVFSFAYLSFFAVRAFQAKVIIYVSG
jgi:capsular polysaccharide biosynthesis protein